MHHYMHHDIGQQLLGMLVMQAISYYLPNNKIQANTTQTILRQLADKQFYNICSIKYIQGCNVTDTTRFSRFKPSPRSR